MDCTSKNYLFRKNFNSRAVIRQMKSLTLCASSSMAGNAISNTTRWSKFIRLRWPWCNISCEGKLHQRQHLTLSITPSVLCSPVLVTACESSIYKNPCKKSSSKWNNYCKRLEILKKSSFFITKQSLTHYFSTTYFLHFKISWSIFLLGYKKIHFLKDI